MSEFLDWNDLGFNAGWAWAARGEPTTGMGEAGDRHAAQLGLTGDTWICYLDGFLTGVEEYARAVLG